MYAAGTMRPQVKLACNLLAYLSVFSLLLISLSGLLLDLPDLDRAATTKPSVPKFSVRMGRDDQFKIAIFSDLHYGEEEHGWGIDQDLKSTRAMRSVLGDESPDLVVLNGDLVTGENTFKENASDYVHQIVAPMVEHQIPWASTYGNHDSAFNLTREALLQQEQTYDLCLTRSEGQDLPGLTNYWLVVEDSKGEPVAILWFLDSRGGRTFQYKPGEPDYFDDWVAPETAKWFQGKSEQLQHGHGRVVTGLVFTHIPPHIYRQKQLDGVDSNRFPGLHADNPLDFEGSGDDDALFQQALEDTPGVHSIYTGHNHGDSWCSTWPGSSKHASLPFLCFAKHTGYGGYGTWNRGARIIQLTSSPDGIEVSSWVRMENGAVITKVSLNETYGHDEYPAETGEES